MKKILFIFILLLSFPMATDTKAIELSSNYSQSANDDDGWIEVGSIALYEVDFYTEDYGHGPKRVSYAKYAGNGTVKMKVIQGYKTYKVVFKGSSYVIQRLTQLKYMNSCGPDGKSPISFNSTIGTYLCNF